MRECDGLLSFACKGVEDRLVLVLGIAIGSGLDGIFAEAAPGMLHEIGGGVLVALVEVAPNAAERRLAMASSAGEKVERAVVEPFDSDIVFEERVNRGAPSSFGCIWGTRQQVKDLEDGRTYQALFRNLQYWGPRT